MDANNQSDHSMEDVAKAIANTSTWMTNLPQATRELPLTQIAIPGTHDSGAFRLDEKGRFAPDAPDAIKYLWWFPPVMRITANWGRTQGLNITKQLQAGLRYFDLRAALNPDENELYLVHTLYGPKISDVLSDINAFLSDHPKEIVLLDFNHFYNMHEKENKTLLDMLWEQFGSKLCDSSYTVANLTLDQMFQQGKQVIVFYKDSSGLPEKVKVATQATILSPWPRATEATDCIDFLNETFSRKLCSDFSVCQGVLTPTNKTVAFDLCGSLHRLNKTLSPKLIKWLQETQYNLNIIITDFAEEANFVDTVLARNSSTFVRHDDTQTCDWTHTSNVMNE